MRILNKLRLCIARVFRESSHVHFRGRSVENFVDLIGLIDRFIDGNPRYPLEWDDFISWKHEHPDIEAIRQRLEDYERLLFSKNKKDRSIYISILIEERNKVAAALGLSAREKVS